MRARAWLRTLAARVRDTRRGAVQCANSSRIGMLTNESRASAMQCITLTRLVTRIEESTYMASLRVKSETLNVMKVMHGMVAQVACTMNRIERYIREILSFSRMGRTRKMVIFARAR